MQQREIATYSILLYPDWRTVDDQEGCLTGRQDKGASTIVSIRLIRDLHASFVASEDDAGWGDDQNTAATALLEIMSNHHRHH